MLLHKPDTAVGISRPYNLVINVLRVVWVATLGYYELSVFKDAVSKCSWPDSDPESRLLDLHSNHDHIPHGHDPLPIHVLLVADPQILDARSYPGRNRLLMWISQLMVDLNLRKSWRATIQLRPSAIIFLGDMMDGGRTAVSDEAYEKYYERFQRIFRTHEPIPRYYLPGNHDVGLGSSLQFSDQADERFESHFGPLNQVIDIGAYTFVMIDSQSLVEEEQARAASGLSYTRWAAIRPEGVISFVFQSLVAREGPFMLLSHIPLARSSDAACGPVRERETIRAGFGHGYQNLLAPETSDFLLQTIRPVLVFSGDDHDYCEYTHAYSALDDPDSPTSPSVSDSAREVTVKSFSMAMGIREPGFQLLSLPPSTDMPLATVPCLLPDQLDIYVSIYVPLIAFSLAVLFLSNFHRIRTRGRYVIWVSLPAWLQCFQSRTIVLYGKRITLGFPSQEDAERSDNNATTGSGNAEKPGSAASQTRAGLFRGFAHDALGVAWVSLVWLMLISWWAS